MESQLESQSTQKWSIQITTKLNALVAKMLMMAKEGKVVASRAGRGPRDKVPPNALCIHCNALQMFIVMTFQVCFV